MTVNWVFKIQRQPSKFLYIINENSLNMYLKLTGNIVKSQIMTPQSNVTIRLANESETYEPGQAITGKVVIKTDIEEEIKGKGKNASTK